MQFLVALAAVAGAIALWAAIPVFSLLVGTGLAVLFIWHLIKN